MQIQPPNLLAPANGTENFEMLSIFPLNGASGLSKLHTVVPLPVDGEPFDYSGLHISVGGEILSTQRRLIARCGDRPASVELVAVGLVGPDSSVAHVVQVEPSLFDGQAALEGSWYHPQLEQALKDGFEFCLEQEASGAGDRLRIDGSVFDDNDRAVSGPVYTEFEINDTLAGIHIRTWVRVYRNLPVIEFDFDMQNGVVDAPVGDVLFKNFYLSMAEGYFATSLTPVRTFENYAAPVEASEETFSGDALDDSRTLFYMADAEQDLQDSADRHCFLMHRSFNARLVIAPVSQEEIADSVAELRGWGRCLGDFSYFSPKTPTYNPHLTPLPRLTGSLDQLAKKYQKRWDFHREALRTGAPIQSELKGAWLGEVGGGLFRPWGPAYGGVSGGSGLGMRSNVETAAIGTSESVLQLMLEHWADSCSRPTLGLVNSDGSPFDPQDAPNGAVFLDPGAENWNSHRAPGVTKDWAGLNAFRTAERNQEVEDQCSYARELKGRGFMDSQHGGRHIQDCAALVMLTGDRIAARHMELRATASWFERKDSYRDDWAEANAQRGFDVKRGDGWALRTIAEAFRFEDCFRGNPELALGAARHAQKACDFAAAVQMPSGLIMRNHETKYAKELAEAQGVEDWPGANSPWQDAILADGLYACAMSLFQVFEPNSGHLQKAFNTVIGVAYGHLWAWRGNGNHWDLVGVAPKKGADLYDSVSQMPEHFKRGATNYYLPPLVVDAAMACIHGKRPDDLRTIVIPLLERTLNGMSLKTYGSSGLQDERNMKAPLIWVAENFDTQALLSLAGSKPQEI